MPTKQANHRADQDHRAHAKIIKSVFCQSQSRWETSPETGSERAKESRVSIKTINTYFIVLDCRDSLCLAGFFFVVVRSFALNGLRVYLNILMTV